MDVVLVAEIPRTTEPHGAPPPVDRSTKMISQTDDSSGLRIVSLGTSSSLHGSDSPASSSPVGVKKQTDDASGRRMIKDEPAIMAMTRSGDIVVKRPKFALTLYSFIASNSRQISFHANEIILVVDYSDNNGWWQVCFVFSFLFSFP